MGTEEFLSLVHARKGHFAYESNHHSDFWLDLETLCADPAAVVPHVRSLAERLRPYQPEVVCAPLIEGAFVGLLCAVELRCEFTYAARFAPEDNRGLYPVVYKVPSTLRDRLRGRRVSVVNDVISAGSAVRGVISDVDALDVRLVAVATLALAGSQFLPFANARGIPVEALVRLPNNLWTPSECPLCSAGIPLDHVADA